MQERRNKKRREIQKENVKKLGGSNRDQGPVLYLKSSQHPNPAFRNSGCIYTCNLGCGPPCGRYCWYSHRYSEAPRRCTARWVTQIWLGEHKHRRRRLSWHQLKAEVMACIWTTCRQASSRCTCRGLSGSQPMLSLPPDRTVEPRASEAQGWGAASRRVGLWNRGAVSLVQ